jgi:hypothetical protein
MSELSPKVAKLREFLEQLDIPSSTLKKDPWGATWLPAELRALVDGGGECREELRRFVDRELELFGSVRQRGDAMFTARVIKAAAPVEIAGAGLDPRVRSVILGLAYALATAVAYLTVAPFIGLAGLADHGSVVGRIQAAVGLGEGLSTSWGLALIGTAIVTALAAAFVPSRSMPRP